MNSKTIAGIGAGIAVIIIAVLIFVISSPEQNGIEPMITKNENIGLVINTPTSAVTIQALDEIYDEAASTGIGRSNVYLFWNLIEPEKGKHNFRESDVFMSLNKKHDLKVTLYFSIINGCICCSVLFLKYLRKWPIDCRSLFHDLLLFLE